MLRNVPLFLSFLKRNLVSENRKERARGLHGVRAHKDSIELEETEAMRRNQIQISKQKPEVFRIGLSVCLHPERAVHSPMLLTFRLTRDQEFSPELQRGIFSQQCEPSM